MIKGKTGLILLFYLPFFFFCCGTVSAEVSTEGHGQKMLDQQTAKLSATLLANDWLKKFEGQSFPDASRILYDEMQKNPA